MNAIRFEDLTPELQKVLDPAKAQTHVMIAKGVAPLPPPILFSAWVYLLKNAEAQIAQFAEQSLKNYPEKMLLSLASQELPSWVLDEMARQFRKNEILLEAILLNVETPNSVFMDVAVDCSERLTILICNNQERLIEMPEIILQLEKNSHNLRSNTDRLRHFLAISGIRIPGDAMEVREDKPEEGPAEVKTAPDGAPEAAPETPEDALKNSNLTDDQRVSLLTYIQKLSIGGRIKLAMKGNKEVRQICIRDTNKVVALAVLKSPRITELEVAHYATLKSLSDDVMRVMSVNPTWTKNYAVKTNLCFHPKTPLQQSMNFMKFLTLRDLGRLVKDKGVPGPLQKAAKELLALKRR